MKPVFICLVGIPGAGKSTYVKQYEAEGYVIHASDKLRAEMGDETDQSHNTEVFEMFYNTGYDTTVTINYSSSSKSYVDSLFDGEWGEEPGRYIKGVQVS